MVDTKTRTRQQVWRKQNPLSYVVFKPTRLIDRAELYSCTSSSRAEVTGGGEFTETGSDIDMTRL